MKLLALLPAIALTVTASAQVPKPFAGLFEKDVPVKGQIGVPMPPPAIEKYIAKVEAAVQQDPKWFKEFSASAKPNEPLPYHENIGLTKEEYDDYLKLWSQREFRQIGDLEGARDLLQEVIAKADGALKQKAQRMFDSLG